MDFIPCPRCQEMNPPNQAQCTACGASLDEEPIVVAPLSFAPEDEPQPPAAEASPPAAPTPTAPAVPPTGAGIAPPSAHVSPPPARGPAAHAGAVRAPALDAPPHTAGAPSVPADLPPEAAAEATSLEQQIAARPQAKGLYVKLAELYQHAGHKEAAVSVLERLLLVDPGNALARHRIDVLRGTVHHHPAPAVAAVHPVVRPSRPAAHPAAHRRSSRRGLWIGLGAAAVVVIGAALWLFSGPTRLVAGRSPVFSPQGDRIAFLGEQGSSAVLNIHDLRTGKTRTVGKASGYTGEGAGVVWSPDGRQVAFVAPAEDEMGEEAVFVAGADSGEARLLATGSSPSWSPDGRSIGMFCREPPRVTATIMTEEGEIPAEFGEGWTGVCVVDVADGGVRRLRAVTGSHLAFSPKAQTLVLERFPEEFPEEGEAPAAAGADDELQSLADEAVAGGATNVYEGSRDLGRAIEARGLDKRGASGVGAVFGDLLAIDADTGALAALTQDGRSANPRWTADGRIAFVHQPSGAPGAEVWIMAADGSDRQRAVEAPIELFDPAAVAVLPDRRVVFASPIKGVNTGLAQLMTGEEAADLHVVRPGDKAPRRLKNRHSFKQRFALSPDGRRIVYEAVDRKTGRSELWLMKP